MPETTRLVKNVLLPAGGEGTRLNGYRNPKRCKSLIEAYDGKTMLEHTLSVIKESGVAERVLIVGKPKNYGLMRSIANRVGVNYRYIIDEKQGGVRTLPVLCEAMLEEEPFLQICGHAPPDASYLREMCKIRKTQYDQVLSAYKLRSDKRKLRIAIDGSRVVSFLSAWHNRRDTKKNSVFYADSPYLLTSDIIRRLKEDLCTGSLQSYFQGQIEYTDFYALLAPFPPEADFADDLDNMLLYLHNMAPVEV